MARIEQSIDVNVPAHIAYSRLMQFEQYPRFMENVEEVRRLDDRHLHWQTRAGDRNIEWDAEITEQVPDRCIAWRSTGDRHNEGRVQLQPVTSGLTRITLMLDGELEPQAGTRQGDAEVVLARRAQQDLARFKKFVEGAHDGRALADMDAAAQPAGAAIGKAVGQTAAERDDTGEEPAASATSAASAAYVEQRSGFDRRARSPGRLPNLLQAWSDPLGVMRKVSEEADQIAQKFLGRPPFGVRARPGGGAGGWAPTVEVARRDNHFIVCAELPGVRREDVHGEIRSGKLTIEGDRHPQPQQGQPAFRRSERSYGRFYRVVALPEGADDEAASASMRDGVLEVTVPVAGGPHGRRIDIQGQ